MDPVRLRKSARPRASILLLAQADPRRLRACLVSLATRIGPGTPYELRILLNGADADVVAFVQDEVQGAVVLRSPVNLGFAAGCNHAAEHATGENLVLLNDDTEIEERWLEALLDTADAHPEAGAVGSRLLFPDGRLQEAGSVVWADGSTAPVGRGLEPGSREHEFVREVDYCSACSLLVRRSTWDAVQGLSPDYFPIYYEDTDLAMAIRALGQKVLYTPWSRLRHIESQSTESGFKAFLFGRNGAQFRRRWISDLSGREPADPSSSAAIERAVHRARGYPPRLLIVDDRIPDPSLGSGHARMLDVVVELAAAGYALSFWPSDSSLGDRGRLGDLGVRILDEDVGRHLSLPEVLYDAVVISRPHNFERVASKVRRFQPHAALVYDAEALFHRRLERRDAMTNVVDGAAARAIRVLETGIRKQCDAVVSLSPQEAAFFRRSPGSCPVYEIPPVLRGPRWTDTPFDLRRDAVFVPGWLSGDDDPNTECLLWFLDHVFPLVRARLPWARLRVTGSDLREEIRSRASPWVVPAGRVGDLAGFYASARLAIVPTRVGAGVKNKTVEALQYGVPVVATSVGAEGLSLEAAPGAVWIADRPEEFARGVATLLASRTDWERGRQKISGWLGSWHRPRSQTWKTTLDEILLARSPRSLVAHFRSSRPR